MSFRRAGRGSAYAVALALALTGCGSQVSHEQALREAGVQTAVQNVASEPTGGTDVPVGAVDPAAPAGQVPAASGAVLGAVSPATTTGAGQPAASGGGSKPGSKGGNASTAPGTATSGGTAAVAASGPATGSPVVIGQVGTGSGVLGNITGPGARGLRMWVAWVNDNGGLNGHKVVVYAQDDGGDPAKAASIVRDQVENKGAIAIVAAMIPFNADGVRNYADSKGIPIVGGDGLAPAWQSSPNFFLGATTIDGITYQWTKAVRPGETKTSFFYCVEAALCTTLKNNLDKQVPAAGLKNVYTAGISLTQPSYTSQCQSAQAAGAQVVYIAAEGPSIQRIARSCASLGYKPHFITDSLAINTSQEGDSNLNGMTVTSTAFPYMDSSTPATKGYQDAIKRYDPGLPGAGFAAAGWTSGMLLRKALSTQKLDPAKPITTAQVYDGLYALKAETLGGLVPPLTYKKGQPTPSNLCSYRIEFVNGRFVNPDGMKLFC
jgi:branched-chain amino acid transport system substrate-binding protein